MRPNCFGRVIGAPRAEPHLDRAREKAEKRRGDKKGGSPERSCQLKPGADVMDTMDKLGSLGGPELLVGPSAAPPALPELGPTQARGLAALPAAAGQLHRGMRPVSAPHPAVPGHSGLAAPAASGQLSLMCIWNSLVPMRT